MNLPPTKPNPPPPPAGIVKGECGNCGSKDRRLLHRVMVRGIDRRVCTSCVLRLHPSSFCPSCFEFFEHPPLPSAPTQRFVSCTKCSSLTHLHCLPSPPPPPSPFLCPPCSKPNNFSFFPNANSPIDKHLALVLLCASKITAASMAKYLSHARARADRTVREAAAARKRAKDALDRCSSLDKIKRLEGSLEVSASRNLGVGIGNNHKVVCKKEELNGFIGGQGKVKVPSDVLPLPHTVNKIAANGNDGKLGNREQDLRNCHGRIVDVTSTTSSLNIL